MDRMLEPELLDELPASDERALRSRRDLRRINSWMGNVRAVACGLQTAFPGHQPRRIADLGAGDGLFSLALAQRLSLRWKNVTVLLVDRQNNVDPQTLASFDRLGWRAEIVEQDIFHWLAKEESYDCLFANLFLHHFTREELGAFFQKASKKTNCFIACEPRRYRFSLAVSYLLWAIGCSEVTRHDAVISVRAGFRNKELSTVWPERERWQLQEERSGLFSHAFMATKP